MAPGMLRKGLESIGLNGWEKIGKHRRPGQLFKVTRSIMPELGLATPRMLGRGLESRGRKPSKTLKIQVHLWQSKV